MVGRQQSYKLFMKKKGTALVEYHDSQLTATSTMYSHTLCRSNDDTTSRSRQACIHTHLDRGLIPPKMGAHPGTQNFRKNNIFLKDAGQCVESCRLSRAVDSFFSFFPGVAP